VRGLSETANPPSPLAPHPQSRERGTGETAPLAWLSTERTGPRRRDFFRSIAALIADAADALEYAHSVGIVHRDIKPGNLMIDAAGKLWVTDFGLARFGPDAGLTMTGDLLGTLRYMAPEQALAKHGLADHRVDVYGLGATLYELLTGQPAVGGEDKQEVLRRIAFEEPAAPRKLDKAIPAELETITLKCLAKEPKERYATAGELTAELRRFAEDKPIKAKPPGLRERAANWVRRHRALAAVYVLMPLALALSGAAGLTTRFWRDAESARAGEAEARRRLAALSDLHRVNLAHHAWAADDTVRARVLLDRCPAESRNWEWRYVHHLCHDELILPLDNIGGSWLHFAFSPDGRRLAATGNRVITVWDTATGRELHALEHGWRRGNCVAFSPDGTRLAAGGGVWDEKLNGFARGEVKIWDVATSRQLNVLRHPANYVDQIAFSPDGRQLATSETPARLMGAPAINPSEMPVRVWDSATGELIHKLVGHNDLIYGLVFKPDGRHVVSAAIGSPASAVQFRLPNSSLKNGEKEIKVWDLATGCESDGFVVGDEGDSLWLALSPDGRRLASASNEAKDLRVWDLKTHEPILPRYRPGAWGAVFAADGQRLAYRGDDAMVHLIDLGAGANSVRELRHVKAPGERLGGIGLSPDADHLAIAVDPVQARLWDLTRPPIPRLMPNLAQVAFSPDGRWLVSGAGWKNPVDSGRRGLSYTTGAFVYEADRRHSGVTSNQAVFTAGSRDVPTSAESVRCAALSGDGRRIAVVAAADQTIGIWELTTGEQSHTLKGQNPSPVSNLAFSPDGRYLAASSDDAALRVWDLTTDQVFRSLPGHRGAITRIGFSPDGRVLASASADTSVKFWDWAAGRELMTLRGHTDRVNGLAFHPAGRHLATGSADQTVKVWDAATGDEVATLSGHLGPVSSVAFSPDGSRLASGSADRTVRVWDWMIGEEGLTLYVGRPVSDVGFSQDGVRLAAAANGVHIWDATPADAVAGPPATPSVVEEYREYAAAADRFVADFPENPLGRSVAALKHGMLGSILESRCGSPAEVEAEYRKALALMEHVVRQHPEDAGWQDMLGEARNNLAWQLATRPDPNVRDAGQAVELAKAAVSNQPANAAFQNTLGVAHYRAGRWKDAAAALDEAVALKKGGDATDWFFLSMAHWQLGERDRARKDYARAAEWTDKNKPNDDELRRFRTEAARLLGIKDPPPKK
jgi:WD40 repeat protein/Flp pilus assembly protein TadD